MLSASYPYSTGASKQAGWVHVRNGMQPGQPGDTRCYTHCATHAASYMCTGGERCNAVACLVSCSQRGMGLKWIAQGSVGACHSHQQPPGGLGQDPRTLSEPVCTSRTACVTACGSTPGCPVAGLPTGARHGHWPTSGVSLASLAGLVPRHAPARR